MLRRLLPAAVISVTALSTAYASDAPHGADTPSTADASHAVDASQSDSAPVASDPAPPEMPAASIDADTALAILKDGNARFVQGESTFPNLDQDRRCLTTDGGQHPYVSILSCADSRVPPELVFDAGIGEIFAIRVAGNVADTDEIGTLEYGAGHLHTPLIVVMGHTKCGAVTAVVQHAKVGGSIPKLVDNIGPAVETAREKYSGVPESKLIQLAIKENVRQAMTDVLRNSEEIRELVATEKVKIVGAVYDIHNGTIEWIGELPNQSAILDGAVAEHGGNHSEEAKASELIHDDHAATASDDAHAAAGEKKPAADPHAKSDDDHAVKASLHAAPKANAHDTDDAHAPAKKKPTADPHAAPSKGHAPEKKASNKATSSHDEDTKKDSHGATDDAEHGTDADHKDAAHAETTEKQSLVQKHGLLVPGAFLAAGSVLSGGVVFLLKGRTAGAASAASAAHAPTDKHTEKPAEQKSSH